MVRKLLHLIILGAPASGKGTIAKALMDKYGVIQIAPGDILRQNIMKGTPLGMKARHFMEAGKLVPDEIILSSMLQRITEIKNRSWLLDGIPRNRHQAEAIGKEGVQIDAVINLVVPHNEILARVKTRWVHLKSGRVYNIGYKTPKVMGKDDETGEDLVQRPDDKPEIVLERLKLYDKTIGPVLTYYDEKRLLHTFPCRRTCTVWPKISALVDEIAISG